MAEWGMIFTPNMLNYEQNIPLSIFNKLYKQCGSTHPYSIGTILKFYGLGM